MTSPDVFILCRRKARGNSSWHLEQQLNARDINAYRVTAGNDPRYSPERVRAVINYGVSRIPVWAGRLPQGCRWFNEPATVSISANKLDTFRNLRLAGIATLDWTQDRMVATAWKEGGDIVVSRTLLNGARGQGIVLSPPDPLPVADLYTKLFTGETIREYRAYIVGGKVVDITQKRRWRRERLAEAGIDRNDPYTSLIRTNGNGWVFARRSNDAGERVLHQIKQLAEDTASAIWLGIGAVDVVVKTGRSGELLDAAVVEPNTSVSLVGDRTTRSIMADALAEELA